MTPNSIFKSLGLFFLMMSILLGTSCKEEETIIEPLKKYALSYGVSPENMGYVSVLTGPYDEGTAVVLTATAIENYEFQYWESDTINWMTDSSALMNPAEFVIYFNTKVTAVFEYEDIDNDGVKRQLR